MSMEITGGCGYNGCAAQSMTGNQSAACNAKKKETGKIQDTAVENKAKNTESYAKELAKLVPSVKFNVGYSLSSAKSGKTLTVNPKLLEKMQNDPEQEKETKELIKGVESAMRLIESLNKATGWTVVYKHSYIDENGKYHSIGHYRNDFMLNLSDKLRKERQENTKKLLEKSKEKKYGKAKQFIKAKIAGAKGGVVCTNDADLRAFMDALKEDGAGQKDEKNRTADSDKSAEKEQTGVGALLDVRA